MKQPTIDLVNGNKNFGFKNVSQLQWDKFGNLWYIVVDIYGDGSNELEMYQTAEDKELYKNIHGNLIGKIKFD